MLKLQGRWRSDASERYVCDPVCFALDIHPTSWATRCGWQFGHLQYKVHTESTLPATTPGLCLEFVAVPAVLFVFVSIPKFATSDP
eukprot:3130483-Amphidinium_carterae.1